MMPILELVDKHGRAAEWITSMMIFVFGLTLLAPGSTMDTSVSYRAFIIVGLNDISLGLLALFIATNRLVALYRNGMWKRSPIIRGIGAVAGLGFWVGISFAFCWPYVAGISEAPSTATVYIVAAFAEILAAYRSGIDVRNSRIAAG